MMLVKSPKFLAGLTLCITACIIYKYKVRLNTKSMWRALRNLKKICFPLKKDDDDTVVQHHIWNSALFFPDYIPEREDSATRRLIWYLEQSTTTLDICMFCFNFRMIEDAIERIKKNGVTVRILSDKTMSQNTRFMRAGIQVRTKIHCYRNPKSPNLFTDLLHHKFVIIDDYAVLSGSLNWTESGITNNFENVLITNNVRTVKRMKTEFERLWVESEPKSEYAASTSAWNATDHAC